MTWAKGTIKLTAAQSIFTGVAIEELKVGEATVGYRAKRGEMVLEDRSLTKLCKLLWEAST